MIKKAFCLLFIVCFSFFSKSQISIIGRSLLNGSPVANTKIYIQTNGTITQTLNTGSSSDFMIKMGYGKIYQVFLQNLKSPLIHFEVNSTAVPGDKYAYRMTYEMIVPLVDKYDEDIDTNVFNAPFHKIIFDGSTKMIGDSSYNNYFASHILKKHTSANIPGNGLNGNLKTLVGRIRNTSHPELNLGHHEITFMNIAGKIINTTITNKMGYFFYKNYASNEIGSIVMLSKDSVLQSYSFELVNTKAEIISTSSASDGKWKWYTNTKELERLVDNSYTSHLGGKIIVSSPKGKRFFAEKTVYLLNKRHTIIETTKTNIIGSFVFSDIKPENFYCIAIYKKELGPGEKIDILNKNDHYILSLDSFIGDKLAYRLSTSYNKIYNDLLITDEELKMDVKATIYGDNVNNPIGKLKIILLNTEYEPIDSVVTDNFGDFKFKYLPFLKRFYLSADNSDNILDIFKNILIYSSDENLIKIMTHQKGKKFSYNPIAAEIIQLREVEIEDPWIKLIDDPEEDKLATAMLENKLIVENILFENNKFELTAQSKEVLDKIILVLNKRKEVKIEIGAHTDSKGGEQENLMLSRQRAKSVYAYILSSGIDETRLFSKGYGETKPLILCDDKKPCSEADHAKNRRIEFKIIDNNQSPK